MRKHARRVTGLYLLHYGADAEAWSFHDRPVTPAIGTAPLHPRSEGGLRETLERHLPR